MKNPNNPTTEDANVTPPAPEEKVAQADWALAILLTALVGLSGAALLGATFMEMLFDKISAVTRVVVLLPVLLISAYLLVKKWQKLFHRHAAEK